jgi:pilus assembly protein CpaE
VRELAVFGGDPRLEEALRGAGFKTTRFALMDLADLARASKAPAALVVDLRGQHQLPNGIAALRQQHPASGIVLVLTSFEPHLMLEAMRAGVTECVSEPLTAQALEDAVRRVLVGVKSDAPGQIVAFVGAKGGVGATTIAVNTATALARGGAGPTLLIDLHVGTGDAAIFLGVEPRFSVLDALESVHRIDEALFSSLVEKTKLGVNLLASSDRLERGDVDPQRVRALLDFIVRAFRFTVLDVPRTNLAMLDTLDGASRIVIVTNQELPALRSTARLAHSLRARYGASRVKVVVNRFERLNEIGQDDIERVIGDSVKHLIPSDYGAAVEAVNSGRPLVLRDSQLAESFRLLAADLSGIVKKTAVRPTGILGKLAFKRA